MPDFRYANLAVRGRLFDNIVAEQVPLATAMKPDLISFAGGGNDSLRRGVRSGRADGEVDRTIERLRSTGADVVVFRWADLDGGCRVARCCGRGSTRSTWHSTGSRRSMARTWWTCGATASFSTRGLWGIDRLHLSPAGHRRVAGHVLTALGAACDESWLAAPQPPEDLSWMSRKAADARWATQHLAPWVKRRLTGKSSGDRVTAKRPELAPLD